MKSLSRRRPQVVSRWSSVKLATCLITELMAHHLRAPIDYVKDAACALAACSGAHSESSGARTRNLLVRIGTAPPFDPQNPMKLRTSWLESVAQTLAAAPTREDFITAVIGQHLETKVRILTAGRCTRLRAISANIGKLGLERIDKLLDAYRSLLSLAPPGGPDFPNTIPHAFCAHMGILLNIAGGNDMILESVDGETTVVEDKRRAVQAAVADIQEIIKSVCEFVDGVGESGRAAVVNSFRNTSFASLLAQAEVCDWNLIWALNSRGGLLTDRLKAQHMLARMQRFDLVSSLAGADHDAIWIGGGAIVDAEKKKVLIYDRSAAQTIVEAFAHHDNLRALHQLMTTTDCKPVFPYAGRLTDISNELPSSVAELLHDDFIKRLRACY